MIGEHLDSVDAGFLFKRLLKKTRSVGGSSAGDSEVRTTLEPPAAVQQKAHGGTAAADADMDAAISRAMYEDDADSAPPNSSDEE